MIAEIMRVDCPFMVPIMSNCIDHPCYADRARPADHGHRPHGERRGGSGGGGEESQIIPCVDGGARRSPPYADQSLSHLYVSIILNIQFLLSSPFVLFF